MVIRAGTCIHVAGVGSGYENSYTFVPRGYNQRRSICMLSGCCIRGSPFVELLVERIQLNLENCSFRMA